MGSSMVEGSSDTPGRRRGGAEAADVAEAKLLRLLRLLRLPKALICGKLVI
jgi:hypothetical protein